MNQQKNKALVLVVHYASDPNAPTLEELQKGEGVGYLVPMFEAHLRREQKEAPQPVEVENIQAKAS